MASNQKLSITYHLVGQNRGPNHSVIRSSAKRLSGKMTRKLPTRLNVDASFKELVKDNEQVIENYLNRR
ncbi:hypothetical protein [Sporolactobacillus terrae]|uniref:hypothetical protein n=1 Tax=Sporolactobacillus terrae TaxID=269673 RepID=UPI00048D4DC2|nr:hypothetical protein [Sporolactobacillus terrae]